MTICRLLKNLQTKEKKKNGGDFISEYGYKNIIDSETGSIVAVEIATGEIYDTFNADLPIGSKIYTPEQQRQHREWKEREQKKEYKKSVLNSLGKFYFVQADEQFKELSDEAVARLIYLNTFINYNDNKLMLTERTPMKRKDLSVVLGVSKATISRFWKEVCPKYIKENDYSLMFTNDTVFKRGSLQRRQYIAYQRFYCNGVRKLYENTDIKYHKRLGCLFKLLPFINVEYNLICYPDYVLETDIENIKLMSIAEFCKWIGYDIKHLNDLVYTYRNIYFEVDGRQEQFCSLIYDGVNKCGAKICINPHILYNGSDYKKVEVLGAFYKN